jgi:hypothetical protein
VTWGDKATTANGFTTGVTNYVAMMGSCDSVRTTESDQKMKMMMSVRVDKLRAKMFSNSSSAAITASVNKGGSAQALSVSITGNSTALFEDTSNSFTAADTDDLNYSLAGPNSSNVSPQYLAVRMDTSINGNVGTTGTQRGTFLPGQ